MPWVRIDEEFPRHPKLVQVGPLGVALQVAALCYCNYYLTDGFVPFGAVRTLLDFNRVGENIGDQVEVWSELGAVNIANRLVKAGVWEEVDGGFRIHDYDHYQPTRDQVLAERERNARAGKKGGLARAAKRGAKRGASTALDDPLSDGQADRLAKPQAESKPVPVPETVTEVPPPSLHLLVSDPEGLRDATPKNRTEREGKAPRPSQPPRTLRHPADPFVADRVRQIRDEQGPEAAMAYLAKVGENFGTESKAEQLARLERWMAEHPESEAT
jgi:hypothetical protein